MPAMRVRRSPVTVSPVKWMALVPGLLTSSSPTTPPGPVTTLTAPAGKPASSKISANIRALYGVVLAGLKMTALPAARAWVAAMLGMSCGQFHGEMMPMTPIGWWITRMRLLRVSSWMDGLTRPRYRLMPSAASMKCGAE